MLKIRLTRTGKNAQPSFRIVVAEHSWPVKRKYLERLGQYVPAANPKVLTLDKERIEYWLSKGAQPSDTVAGLLKREGFKGMERFVGRRDLKRKKKKGGDESAEAPAAAPVKDPAEAATEAPAAGPAMAETAAGEAAPQ